MTGRAVAALAALLAPVLVAQPSESDAIVRRHVRELADPSPEVRQRAEDALVDFDRVALESLPAAADDAERAYRLERVRRRIRWRLTRRLLDRIEGLFDGFEDLSFRRRLDRLDDLVRLGGEDALPTLRAVAAGDRHPEVRDRARRAAGAIDLGQRMKEAAGPLAAGRIDDAVRIVRRSLEIDPEGPLIHYQLACLYGRAGRLDEAFAELEQALELGFVNFYHMEEDPDLERVRADPRFLDLRTRWEDR